GHTHSRRLTTWCAPRPNSPSFSDQAKLTIIFGSDACIKLSVVASDIFGVSGRAMLAALVAGERDPKVLAQLARARMRGKIDRLQQAFDTHFAAHHLFLLSRMLSRIEALDADIAAVYIQLETQLAPCSEAATHLD